LNATRQSANLDFLRATAVLFVLADHLFVFFGEPTTWFFKPRELGVLGVLLFFVHTCLVLMFSLERQEARLGRRGLFAAFMVRRCFRVFPLSILAVTVVCAARIPMVGIYPGRFVGGAFTPWAVFTNVLLVQNLAGAPSVLLPLWSLPYEMQMYLFLPALYGFVRRISGLRTLLAIWLAAVPIAALQFRYQFQPSLLWLVPAFLPGVIAYWVTTRTRPNRPFWQFAAMLYGLSLIYMMVPGGAASFKGMLVCLAVGLNVARFTEVRAGWLRTFGQLTARYSYGIYITHMPCEWFAFVRLHDLPAPAQWSVFVILAVGLPVLLYHTLEEPMIRLGNRLVETRLTVRAPAVAAPDASAVP
jgi:peptidoglycan/LPS O-acetylase OafA/YrhL